MTPQERLLQDQCEILIERVRQLEDLLMGSPDEQSSLATVFSLTPIEARVLNLLLRRGTVSQESMKDAVWGMRGDGATSTAVANIVCRLRKKLRVHGVVVRTVGYVGYCMSAEMRTRARALVAEQQESGSGDEIHGTGQILRRREGVRLHQA